MRRNSGLITCLAALVLLTLAATFTPVRAETYTALVGISPLNEVPPIPTLTATGGFLVTVEVTRDAAGNIISGKIHYTGVVQGFPAGTEITGLHIHEGEATTNGPVRFDSGLSGGSPQVLSAGAGIVDRDVVTVDPAILKRMIDNPTGFYLNIHTRVNPGGAMRAQLTKLTETLANTVTMTIAQEVPAPVNENGTAQATLTFNPTRNAQGQVTGGTVWFTLAYDFTSPVTFTGLHIHEGPAGAAAGVVINTGLSGSNTIVSATGKGFINIPVQITTAAQIGALTRLLANPAGFYVNIHTTVNPGGVIRAQLTGLSTAVPMVALANKYFLPTGNADATISILATGIDLLSTVQINGQTVNALPDLATGNINVAVPAALLANPGLLNVQVKASNGTLSLPLAVVVGTQAAVNTTAVATVEAAGFSRTSVAPESIGAAFGTRLASQTVVATGATLPLSLDGTTVYVNGIAARLFFVSANQINYLVPEGTSNGLTGPATVVVVAKDGTISQGAVLVTNVAPGIFTRLANGLGAPAAVASADGQNFNINVSNADGTPVELQAGNFVALFGTGLRFTSRTAAGVYNGKITAGGVDITPSFIGAQLQFAGLDQVNLQLPLSLAGKGEIDLTITVDGRTSNAVRIKVK
jgi:uncharacterized protein (TIGR03437 family)